MLGFMAYTGQMSIKMIQVYGYLRNLRNLQSPTKGYHSKPIRNLQITVLLQSKIVNNSEMRSQDELTEIITYKSCIVSNWL